MKRASTSNRIAVLVVDDHPVVCSGIAAIVNGQTDMEVVAVAASGKAAIEAFGQRISPTSS